MKIGIIIAMEKEREQVESLLQGRTEEDAGGVRYVRGEAGAHEAVLLQCGIGKVNAAVGAVRLIEYARPDAVLSTGIAGGASADIDIQDVVVSTETVYHDLYTGTYAEYGQVPGLPRRFGADPALVRKAAALSCGTRIHPGLIVTGDWFVDTEDKMREILGHFPDACAVDMESAAIAQVCCLCGVPFLSFRIISDLPLRKNHAQQYTDFWTRLADSSFAVTESFLRSL